MVLRGLSCLPLRHGLKAVNELTQAGSGTGRFSCGVNGTGTSLLTGLVAQLVCLDPQGIDHAHGPLLHCAPKSSEREPPATGLVPSWLLVDPGLDVPPGPNGQHTEFKPCRRLC
ncbi:hypothetical protein ACFSC4_23125 [Deinococcus malanensis]|uniref:hypothetical protein n=1 Tax=Deinococcus malanensis TaxID=1706855 RepID=UPI003642B581